MLLWTGCLMSCKIGSNCECSWSVYYFTGWSRDGEQVRNVTTDQRGVFANRRKAVLALIWNGILMDFYSSWRSVICESPSTQSIRSITVFFVSSKTVTVVWLTEREFLDLFFRMITVGIVWKITFVSKENLFLNCILSLPVSCRKMGIISHSLSLISWN